MKKLAVAGSVAVALITSPGEAFAHTKGELILRAGLTTVAPNDDSGKVATEFLDLGATNMEVGVDSNTQLGLNVALMMTDNWAVELLAATPFTHDINLEKSQLGLGDGKLAEVTQLPPTVSALYYFNTQAQLKPYVGLGLNYTLFFNEDFTSAREVQGFSDLDLDSSFGLSAQVGFDYQINANWLFNASIRYIDINTEANFKVGGLTSSVKVDVDPYVYSLTLGYKF